MVHQISHRGSSVRLYHDSFVLLHSTSASLYCIMHAVAAACTCTRDGKVRTFTSHFID